MRRRLPPNAPPAPRQAGGSRLDRDARVVKALLEVTGCCGRYRAHFDVRPSQTALLMIDGFGPTPEAARQAALDVARAVALPGFDPDAVEPRRWPAGHPR